MEVALRGRQGGALDAQDQAEELRQLSESAGFTTAGQMVVRRDRPDPALYLGRGKVDEIRERLRASGCGILVVGVPLSPVQQRNLERELEVAVLDRTALILDIFAQRAQSREGKLQVELARLQHLSTRLVRGWTHLERQRGGIGLRAGPGEKQIELDRRMIGQRVKQLRERLRTLDAQRRTQRKARRRREAFCVSLVGYTNAGKSTLFNALTRSSALCADQLFATLDTTSRRCFVAPGVPVVLSDTVGFIRDLPHALIEAFKATLDEAAQADLLVHVVDASAASREAQMAAVDEVLQEIGASEVPRCVVFNKIDQVERRASVETAACGRIETVWLSARSGNGLELLRGAIAQRAQEQTAEQTAEQAAEQTARQTAEPYPGDAGILPFSDSHPT
ncbi:MAG: GTPase HflX [Burkholderiaceae bacterium]|nr:GTPase HflX [Burkholderiaceae bacterium]